MSKRSCREAGARGTELRERDLIEVTHATGYKPIISASGEDGDGGGRRRWATSQQLSITATNLERLQADVFGIDPPAVPGDPGAINKIVIVGRWITGRRCSAGIRHGIISPTLARGGLGNPASHDAGAHYIVRLTL